MTDEEQIDGETYAEKDANGDIVVRPDVVSPESIATDYRFAAAYSGADPETRLDNALSAASDDDTIYLEGAPYDNNRSVSKSITFVGPSGGFDGARINGDWAVNTDNVSFCRVNGNNGSLTVNEASCAWSDSSFGGSFTITVDANNFRFVNNTSFGSVTFNSGTSRGVVDGIAGDHTTTDNDGSNILGDGA